MSEAAEDPKTEADPKSTAIVPVRERLVTRNAVAIWDTAELEHMGRVGAIMAESGLASETFFKDGDQAAPPKMVVARMVMVANVAREVEADPLMFLQGCSIISRKLHLEGKLVNAIIRKRTGVNLKFRFGAWDTDHIEFPPLIQATDESGEPMEKDGKPVMVPDPKFFIGLGERLAVRCYDPEDPERFVDGSVGLWKTTRSGSPWTAQGNWRRQLRYRGAPEWARAYEPGAVLGIFTDADEDLDDMRDVSPRASGVMARLSGKQEGDGFNADHVQAETTKRKPGRPKKDATPPHDPETGEVVEERPTSTEAPTETAIAQSAEQEPASSASATDAPTDSAEETSSPTSPGEPSENGAPEIDIIAEGYPAPDEIYHLTGDAWEPNLQRGEARRETYKNGQPFSDANRDKGYAIYEDHAPEGPGSQASAEAANAATEIPAPDGADLPEDLAPETRAYVLALRRAQTWDDVKTVLKDYLNGPHFKAMSVADQNEVRGNTYAELFDASQRATKPLKLPDHAMDVSLFRLWIEAQGDPDAIEGTLAVLESKSAMFQQAGPGVQNGIRAAAAARIAAVKG